MPYAEVNDIRMYYDEVGSGPSLILLNGATGTNSTMWTSLRSVLAEQYRVLHVEHRGHGRTNNPAGHINYELVASDVVAFIEGHDLAPVHVAGASDGAITALVIGMRRPDLVRSIVAVGANYCNDDQVLEANRLIDVETIEREHPHFAELLADAHDPNHEPGYWRTLVSQLAENLARNPAYTETDLQGIVAPTLLITGETDLWCNLNQIMPMRKAIPNSEMMILNHAGQSWIANHAVQDTRAEIVGPAMLEFLRRNSG